MRVVRAIARRNPWHSLFIEKRQVSQDRKRQDAQDKFWVAGLPCILAFLPDPPAKRILYFFSSKLSCNFPVRVVLSLLCVPFLLFGEKVTYPLRKEPIDVVIPCAKKDRKIVEFCIEGIKTYVDNVGRIIVVSEEPFTPLAEWVSETAYPFSKWTLALALFKEDPLAAQDFINSPKTKISWIYQQLLKLYAPLVIPGISSNVLLVDADVIFLNPITFMTEKAEPLFAGTINYHEPYFAHMARLLPGLQRADEKYTGVVHHMLFQRPILEDLFAQIEKVHGEEPWKAIAHCVDTQEVYGACCSDYEIYFNFALLRTDQAHVRPFRWEDSYDPTPERLREFKREGNIFVAFHHYLAGTFSTPFRKAIPPLPSALAKRDEALGISPD